MPLERLLREQVYKYKRKQYLRKSSGNKIGDSQFMVFNVNKLHSDATKMSPQSLTNKRSPRKASSRSHRARKFYASPINDIGAKKVAGFICIILALILICTQCFSPKVQPAMAGQDEVAITPNKIIDNNQGNLPSKTTENPVTEKELSKEKGEMKKVSTLQTYYEGIQNFNIAEKRLTKLFDIANQNKRGYSQALATWFVGQLEQSTDKEIYELLKKYNHDYMLKNYPSYKAGESIYKQFVYDMKYFPIPKYKKYIIEPTWVQRTLHQEMDSYGIDIIDPKNNPGKIPVVNIVDGIVEGLGWHEIGGYRVGIKSEGGAYFYYGHLDELPTHIQKGDKVQAGEYLGRMGNTGYGEEGTRGKIPVKLHIGIAVQAKDGSAFWINPYPFLKNIEGKKASIKQ